MSTFKQRSKWNKYLIMRKSKDLRTHIPVTKGMNFGKLWRFLAKYGDVILKPSHGSRGAGLIRITAVGTDVYEVQIENIKKTFTGQYLVNDYIKEKVGIRKYIIQRRIPLATVDGRPFDMRIVVQRKKAYLSWEVTGMVAKVAGEGYFVTNISRSSGTILPLETAIRRSSLASYSNSRLIAEISRVALLTAEKLSGSEYYKNQLIYGFDMGLDRTGRVWVIEANLKPMLTHFRKLADKSMYRRILEYKKG
ncbi:YheC/YheD family protein [Paenibacillus sp. sptzw28]|uniref:YheC/YheD family protein n=1 Tax=Paenibacillus sp. sptzw28 TaxID=715179 RepID=UPI002161C9D1|nr:YheC/YheD family protein [Paenibacillus sp. sptzw28]